MKCEGLNTKNFHAHFKGSKMPAGGQFAYSNFASNPSFAQNLPDTFNYTNPSNNNYRPYNYPPHGGYSPQDGSFGDDTNEKSEMEKNPVGSLTSLGILQLVSSGLQKLSQICAYKLSAGKEFADGATVKKMAEGMKNKNGLDVAIEYITPKNMGKIGAKYGVGGMLDEVARGQNAFYMDIKKLAVAPDSKPSLILHELGHAVNAKKPLTKLLQSSRMIAPYAPTAILFASQLVPDKKDGKPSFFKKYGGVLGFMAFLPTIIEEAMASGRGIKAAKSALGKSPAIKTLAKNYGFALATYIISGIALGVSTKIAIKEREAGIVRY